MILTHLALFSFLNGASAVTGVDPTYYDTIDLNLYFDDELTVSLRTAGDAVTQSLSFNDELSRPLRIASDEITTNLEFE